MKKIYICSPYRGDVNRNVANARQYCKQAIEKGFHPVAPHLFFPQFLDDKSPTERAFGMRLGSELLQQCDEVWVFGSPTTGMKAEIKEAQERGIPIYKVTLGLESEVY